MDSGPRPGAKRRVGWTVTGGMSDANGMPVAYERDNDRRLITATLTEPASMVEYVSVVERQAAEETWDYALLYDLRGLTIHAHSSVALQQFIDRVQSLGAGRARGPVAALLAPRPDIVRSTVMTTQLTTGRLNFELLLDDAQLAAWLLRSAPSRTR
jgi:hypothetical protein